MEITKVRLTLSSLTNDGPAIVTSVSEAHRFEDGKVTDEIEGYKVEVVATGNGFEKFSVKVAEKPAISDAMLGKASVDFDGFEAKPYKDFRNNTVGISCKAKSVNVIKG